MDTAADFRLAWLYLIEVAKYTAFVILAVVVATNLLYGVMPWRVWRRHNKETRR